MTPTQHRLLDLEADVAAGRLSRSEALGLAYDEFGLSEPRYYQQLLDSLSDPEALAAHPTLVHRLERLRQRGRRRRR